MPDGIGKKGVWHEEDVYAVPFRCEGLLKLMVRVGEE